MRVAGKDWEGERKGKRQKEERRGTKGRKEMERYRKEKEAFLKFRKVQCFSMFGPASVETRVLMCSNFYYKKSYDVIVIQSL